jgi:hypothetical protein
VFLLCLGGNERVWRTGVELAARPGALSASIDRCGCVGCCDMLHAGLARACRLVSCGLKTATDAGRHVAAAPVSGCSCVQLLELSLGMQWVSGAELLTRERAHVAAHFA